ncbi:MAG: Ankyrin repeats (3 copies) [bacterium ADurb.BinA186]|nr:MAG: Ankyrin repeats (3 copies) [bacterium ADurb.BinA186]
MTMLAILWESSELSQLLEIPELDILFQIPSPDAIAALKADALAGVALKGAEKKRTRTSKRKKERHNDEPQVRILKSKDEEITRKSHRKATIDKKTHERSINEQSPEEPDFKPRESRRKATAVKSDGHDPAKVLKRSENKGHTRRHRSMPSTFETELGAHGHESLRLDARMEGFNALHIAVWGNKIGAVARLLNYGHSRLLMQKNALGDTPLHLAIKLRNIGMVKALLSDPLEGEEIGIYQFCLQQALATCNNENLQPIFAAYALIETPKRGELIRRNIEHDALDIIALLLDVGDNNLIRHDGKSLYSLAKKQEFGVLLGQIFSLGRPLVGMTAQEQRVIGYINKNGEEFKKYAEEMQPYYAFKGIVGNYLLSKGLTGPISNLAPKAQLAGTQAQKRRKSFKVMRLITGDKNTQNH